MKNYWNYVPVKKTGTPKQTFHSNLMPSSKSILRVKDLNIFLSAQGAFPHHSSQRTCCLSVRCVWGRCLPHLKKRTHICKNPKTTISTSARKLVIVYSDKRGVGLFYLYQHYESIRSTCLVTSHTLVMRMYVAHARANVLHEEGYICWKHWTLQDLAQTCSRPWPFWWYSINACHSVHHNYQPSKSWNSRGLAHDVVQRIRIGRPSLLWVLFGLRRD